MMAVRNIDSAGGSDHSGKGTALDGRGKVITFAADLFDGKLNVGLSDFHLSRTHLVYGNENLVRLQTKSGKTNQEKWENPNPVFAKTKKQGISIALPRFLKKYPLPFQGDLPCPGSARLFRSFSSAYTASIQGT